jgi:hypothetical protein
MSKNVMIPVSLLDRTIVLLGDDLMPNQLHDVTFEHACVLDALSFIKEKTELRKAYAKIISTDNEEARHDARIEYLRQKRHLKEMEQYYQEMLS